MYFTEEKSRSVLARINDLSRIASHLDNKFPEDDDIKRMYFEVIDLKEVVVGKLEESVQQNFCPMRGGN